MPPSSLLPELARLTDTGDCQFVVDSDNLNSGPYICIADSSLIHRALSLAMEVSTPNLPAFKSSALSSGIIMSSVIRFLMSEHLIWEIQKSFLLFCFHGLLFSRAVLDETVCHLTRGQVVLCNMHQASHVKGLSNYLEKKINIKTKYSWKAVLSQRFIM